MAVNTGKEFEKLVESIFNKLIKDPRFEKVEQNIQLDGPDGERQIDVLITAEIAGVKFLTVIECKDYKNKVSIPTIDGFHSKLIDVGAKKGIIISAKGFSSKAISKAKRLGISLCTAQEALSEKWVIDLDLPVIFKEMRPADIKFQYTAKLAGGTRGSTNRFPSINGKPVQDLLTSSWKDGSLIFFEKEGFQTVILPNITEPIMMNINTLDEKEIEVTDFKVFIDLKIKYFETTLENLAGTKVLKDIIDKKAAIFIDKGSLDQTLDSLKEVKKISIKKSLFILIKAKVTPNFGTKPSTFNIGKNLLT
jgi:hypothetical protein